MCNEFTQIHNIEIDNNIFNNKMIFYKRNNQIQKNYLH